MDIGFLDVKVDTLRGVYGKNSFQSYIQVHLKAHYGDDGSSHTVESKIWVKLDLASR